MLEAIRGSVTSHMLVAGAAAALSALVTWQGAPLVTSSAAQPATPGVMDVLPLGTPRQLIALSYTTSHFLHQIDAFTINKRIRDLPDEPCIARVII